MAELSHVRIALGGVGTKPWRARAEAEAALASATPDADACARAAAAALADAKPQSQNGFKVELAQRCLVHALRQAT